MRPEHGFCISPDIGKMTMTSHFAIMTSLLSFDIALFLLVILVTVPSFMPISSRILELLQFTFIRD